jgi:transposase
MPSKKPSLRASGCLNPMAEGVRDSRFQEIEFFDADDLVQVKYEMLRRVQTEGGSVSEAARDFGYSRLAYYRAQGKFDQEGMVGLVPKKRGPKGGHKLTAEVVDFLAETLASEPELRSLDLAKRVAERFGSVVHRRSIERALARRKKNSR